MPLNIQKVYGPYQNKRTGKFFVNVLYKDGYRKSTSLARHLMEKHLDRSLEDDEQVLPIDGDRTNFRINNLEIVKGEKLLRDYRRK